MLTLKGFTIAEAVEDGPEGEAPLRTIGAHASAYVAHVRRKLRHTLPKAIVHCLVRADWIILHPDPVRRRRRDETPERRSERRSPSDSHT